jgi:hypothetical protein
MTLPGMTVTCVEGRLVIAAVTIKPNAAVNNKANLNSRLIFRSKRFGCRTPNAKEFVLFRCFLSFLNQIELEPILGRFERSIRHVMPGATTSRRCSELPSCDETSKSHCGNNDRVCVKNGIHWITALGKQRASPDNTLSKENDEKKTH